MAKQHRIEGIQFIQSDDSEDSKEKLDTFPAGVFQSDTEVKRKESDGSLDSRIWDNSYTIINEAEQDLLEKLDDILRQYKGNKVPELSFKSSKISKQSANNLQYSISELHQNLDLSLKPTFNQSNLQTSLQSQDFFTLETLIYQYKHDLIRYQQVVVLQLQQKDTQNKELIQQNFYLKHDLQQVKNRNFKLQKQVFSLQRKNSELKQELQNYEKLKPSRASKRLMNELDDLQRRVMNESSRQFGKAVRNQMEYMIERLVQQLKIEKGLNAKLKNQILRCQNQLIEAQQKIWGKNEQIYRMEMSIILKEKEENRLKSALASTGTSSEQILEEKQQQAPITRNTSLWQTEKQVQQDTCFNIMQIINQQREVSRIQKLAIGSKIVEFYENKLGTRDYQILMAENIIVCNYPMPTPLSAIDKLDNLTIRPYKTRCKRFQVVARETEQVLKESLLYNLAFILDALFKHNLQNQCSTLSDILQNDIRTKIDKIFSQKLSSKSQTFIQLKELLATSLSLEKDQYL